MCGIAGIIGKYSESEKLMIANEMRHRGPDGVGFFENKNFCFIHTLLKIMDLSPNSKQPMIDHENGNVIIFNGAIYNYKELRDKFFKNKKLTSDTDTEILLLLYQKFGIKFLDKVKGMFSLAIYDKKNEKIFIIRDRYGIKPLYYYNDSDHFIFASEIKILLKHKKIKSTLNLNVDEVLKFIGHRQILGFKNTLLKNIKSLEQGRILELDIKTKNFKIDFYDQKIDNFNLSENINNNIFENKFNEVIKYHTITEHKKIACLLSGGIDSSLLSILLKSQSEDKEIHTFSSILDNPNEENLNIKKLVKENNFFHHFVSENSINFFDDHLKTIKDMDQPTADAATTLHNVLCREVSKNGFKVLFSGNGGDEHFFGYPLHIYGFLASILDQKKFRLYFNELKKIKKYSAKKELFIRSIKELFSQKILNQIKRKQLKSRVKHLEFNYDHIKNVNFYENFSNNIFKNIIMNYKTHWGLQSFLDYEDKNSMAYGIECRVPFLDSDIANINFNTKLSKHFEFGTKSLLRKHSKMPIYIGNKREKYGFAANLEGYVDKNIDKMNEKIFYEFKDVPLIKRDKLIDMSKSNNKDYGVFFRTYSYGVWYKHTFG